MLRGDHRLFDLNRQQGQLSTYWFSSKQIKLKDCFIHCIKLKKRLKRGIKDNAENEKRLEKKKVKFDEDVIAVNVAKIDKQLKLKKKAKKKKQKPVKTNATSRITSLAVANEQNEEEPAEFESSLYFNFMNSHGQSHYLSRVNVKKCRLGQNSCYQRVY